MVLFKADGAVPFGVGAGGGIAWHWYVVEFKVVPFGQDVHVLVSRLKLGVGSVQLMQPVPFQKGVASGHGTVVFDGRVEAGL